MDIGELAARFGVPTAFVLVALFAGRAKIWVWGWYAAELQQRLIDQRTDYEARLKASDERGETARKLAWTLATQTNRALTVAEKQTGGEGG